MNECPLAHCVLLRIIHASSSLAHTFLEKGNPVDVRVMRRFSGQAGQ